MDFIAEKVSFHRDIFRARIRYSIMCVTLYLAEMLSGVLTRNALNIYVTVARIVHTRTDPR